MVRDKIKGRYQILKKLRCGAIVQVYLAYDEKKKMQVKILMYETKNGAGKSEKDMDFFIRGTKTLMQMQHHNISSLKDSGNHKGSLFIVMEYGSNLLEVIQRKKQICPKHAAQLMIGVLKGLKYMHEIHNFTHREVEPVNLYLCKYKRKVKLVLNLGLEEIGESSVATTTISYCSYMPFEQIQSKSNVGHTTDIYSVGATLFHSLAGIAPYQEYVPSLVKQLHAKLHCRYRRLKDIKPDVPDEMIRIVEKAMAHIPSDRYQTAEEMCIDLQNFLSEIEASKSK